MVEVEIIDPLQIMRNGEVKMQNYFNVLPKTLKRLSNDRPQSCSCQNG